MYLTQSVIGLALGFAWLSLPLIPAIRELRRPTDAQALNVFQGNAADAQEGLHHLLPAFYAENKLTSESHNAWSTKFASAGARLWTESVLPHKLDPCLVSHGDLMLEGEMAGCVGAHSRTLTLGHTTRTAARLSARTRAVLTPGCEFQILQAPRIESAPRAGVAPNAMPFAAFQEYLANQSPPAPGAVVGAQHYPMQQWWRARAHAEVPDGVLVSGDIVATGDVRVGCHARVAGSIKSGGQVTLGTGAVVTGNIVASQVRLAPLARAGGSVLAEVEVQLEMASSVGSPDREATVASERIYLEESVVIYGGIFAHKGAMVRVRETESSTLN
jgi:hypothetical protein